MNAQRRRTWIVVGLTVVTAVGLGLAWWLRPAPPAPDALYAPVSSGLKVPPLPPPPPTPPPQVPDASTDDSDDEALGAFQLELPADLLADPDLPAPYIGRTEDGAAVRPGEGQVTVLPSGNFAPNMTGVTGLSLGGSQLLIEASSIEGSLMYVAPVSDLASLRAVSLAGWAPTRTGQARARQPALSPGGAWLLAEDASGQTLVWTVDMTEATASPVVATGWPRGGVPGRLSASGSTLAVTVSGAQVGVLSGGVWSTRAEGPAGIASLHVAERGAQLEMALTRRGRVYRLTPERSVPASVAFGSHGVRLAGHTAYVSGGLVWTKADGGDAVSAGAIRLLADRSLVAVGEDRVAWVRPDGRLGVLRLGEEPEALEVGVEGLSALASDDAQVVLLGQVGTERRLEVIEL